jgi:hypothetical protein
MIVLPSTFRINSLVPLLRPDFCALRRMLGRVSVTALTGSDEAGFSAAVDCNSQLRALAIRRPAPAKAAYPILPVIMYDTKIPRRALPECEP